MKNLIQPAFVICLFLVGCNRSIKSDNVKDFIPGTYISSWSTEFSKSIDTLFIGPLLQHGSETYSITRRNYVTFTNDERKRNPEHKIIEWTGSYEPGAKTVVVNNNGKVLSFDPVNKLMKMGTKTYRKL